MTSAIRRRAVDFSTTNTQEIIQKSLLDFTREDLYIGIPATVVGIAKYETDQVVDVRPVINDVYVDTEITRAVTLGSVFVKLPSAGGFSIKFPISVGDLVTLHYCHRDISAFLDGNGQDIDSPLGMVAGIRDCYVTVGFGTRNKHQSPSKSDFIIEGPNTTITITPEGVATLKTKEYIVDAEKTTFLKDVEFKEGIKVDKIVDAENFTAGTFDALTHTHSNGNAGNPTGPYIP